MAWYQCPFAGSKTGVDCAAPGRARPTSSRMRNSGRRKRGSIKGFLMQRWTVLRMKEALRNCRSHVRPKRCLSFSKQSQAQRERLAQGTPSGDPCHGWRSLSGGLAHGKRAPAARPQWRRQGPGVPPEDRRLGSPWFPLRRSSERENGSRPPVSASGNTRRRRKADTAASRADAARTASRAKHPEHIVKFRRPGQLMHCNLLGRPPHPAVLPTQPVCRRSQRVPTP
jgi:hypothetical protein